MAHEELERGSGGTYDLNTLYKYMKLPKEECFYNLGKKTQSYTWSLIKSLIKFNAKLKKNKTPHPPKIFVKKENHSSFLWFLPEEFFLSVPTSYLVPESPQS